MRNYGIASIFSGTFRYGGNRGQGLKPLLRQRQEDIPFLVQAFRERYARKMRKKITTIPKDRMPKLGIVDSEIKKLG